ncbi:hypothetical protein H4R35_003275 [Dimargaris xerosporica]|nr:hypothetical protein H4R35_003275 [Dimargaris xerosporica]
MITHQSDLILSLDFTTSDTRLMGGQVSQSSAVATALPTASTTPLSAKTVIRPLVFFTILDHFLRRNENQDRVIGTLLGRLSDDHSSIEITNCFPVPHFESDDRVEVDMEHHSTMIDLYQRVNPNEAVVGWYATGSNLNSYSALIQDYYNREVSNGQSVHLVLDTELNENSLGVRTFISSPVGSLAKPENCMFVPVPFTVKYNESEITGLDVINQTVQNESDSTAGLISDMDALETALLKVKEMLQRVAQYVDQVIAGQVPGNNVVGRYIMDMLTATPKLDSAAFEQMFHSHLQDVLMVVYLSDLTRTQLNIAERLQRLV